MHTIVLRYRFGVTILGTIYVTFLLSFFFCSVYTDGSKKDSKVGCDVLSDNHCNIQCIPDGTSIFTAEASAVDLALGFIRTSNNNTFII